MGTSIGIIGGGAAGLACAVKAARAGASVVLYERNDKLARKLGITGKGRCNVTNNCTPAEFLSNVTKNEKFLFSAVNKYPPSYVMDFFSSLGVPLKVERGNRVFPVSDRAADIVNALRNEVSRLNVSVKRSCRITSVCKNEDGSFSLSSNGRKFNHEAVVICTGGLSYPLTGSTGDGFVFAEGFGLKLSDTVPSLVSCNTKEDFSSLAGLTLKNIVLSLFKSGKVIFSEIGEMLFTHNGVSGPLVLSASCHMREKADLYSIKLDLKPGIQRDELDRKLVNLFKENGAKDFINATSHLLPQKLVPFIADTADIPQRIKTGEVSAEMRKRYIDTLKNFPITPSSLGSIEEAIITSGGIETKEINPSSMEIKSVPGLFAAGEVIDVDAYTGGFNLQIAFSTGFVAADGAVKYLSRF